MKRFNKCGAKQKNPCKICMLSVNNKTGLKCQGACKKWAHFTCLNYTPGKIQDIKAGILKVLCPCPDCKTVEPKEYLTIPPYTCPDLTCPANQLAECGSPDCPKIKQKPTPPKKKSVDTCQQDSESASEESNQSIPSGFPPTSCTPIAPCAKKNTPCRPRPPATCLEPRSGTCTPPRELKHPPPSSTPSPRNIPHRVCPKPKEDKTCMKKKSVSCSYLPKDSEIKMKVQAASSDSCMRSKDHKVLYKALEDMCKTMGQLSLQLRELMCKMIDSIQTTGSK